MAKGYYKICDKCQAFFTYTDKDVKWDEKSSSGSTKLVSCPKCGRIHILGYIDDAYDNINDIRFYSY